MLKGLICFSGLCQAKITMGISDGALHAERQKGYVCSNAGGEGRYANYSKCLGFFGSCYWEIQFYIDFT